MILDTANQQTMLLSSKVLLSVLLTAVGIYINTSNAAESPLGTGHQSGPQAEMISDIILLKTFNLEKNKIKINKRYKKKRCIFMALETSCKTAW